MAKMLLPKKKKGEKEVRAIKYTLSASFVPGKLLEQDTRRASLPHSPSHAGGRQLCPGEVTMHVLLTEPYRYRFGSVPLLTSLRAGNNNNNPVWYFLRGGVLRGTGHNSQG